jgi:hypothetical protein
VTGSEVWGRVPHQGDLFEEASGSEKDEAVKVVRTGQAAAHDGVDQEGGAAQGVRDGAQAIRLWHASLKLMQRTSASASLPEHQHHNSSSTNEPKMHRKLQEDTSDAIE